MLKNPFLPGKLSSKIVAALLGFLFLALSAIGATLFLSWQLEGSSAAINDAGSLRMQSYRISATLAQATKNPDVAAQVEQIDATFTQLAQGDPQRPLFLPPAKEIQQQFQRSREEWQSSIAPLARSLANTPDARTLQVFQNRIEHFVLTVNTLVQLIERDSERRTFWLRSSQLVLVAMALTGTISMVYLMFMMIVQPVNRLHEGMQRMTEKDFDVRLEVESEDEFGQLAQGFNQMADRLQTLYDSLEQRVRDKTAELAAQNRELALLYENATFLQHNQSMESLCQGFLQRISDYFSADGGSVRMLDVGHDNLHLVVHHGLSEQLVASEHCIKINDCLCGTAVSQRISVVHDMRQIDQQQQLRCHREGFATVSIFHIQTQQHYLGFFNLHFRQMREFAAPERALLETLGQMLGVAVENMRLANREREMAISEERNLVAQGLHDSLAQSLNYVNLQVQMLEQSLAEKHFAEATEIVPALQAGMKQSYDDVRELLLNFRTRLQEGDLLAALGTTIARFRQQTGINTQFEADPDGAPLPREEQLQLLFIVQEALSNIRKHADASQVSIRLTNQLDIELSILDNGKGFNSSAATHGEHHVGLAIMHERARRLNATLRIESQPGHGTRIVLQLPHALRKAA